MGEELEDILKADPSRKLDCSVRISNLLCNLVDHPPDWLSTCKLPPPRTIADLLQWSEVDIHRVNGFGRKSIKELKELLATHGLSLRETSAVPPRTYHPPSVNIIDPVQRILRILEPFPPSLRKRIVRAIQTVVGDS